jgi:hypothetical protein
MKYILASILLSVSLLSYAQNSISTTQTFRDYINAGVTSRDFTKSSRSMVSFNEKQETEGTPYLLNNWGKGNIFFKDNTVLPEPSYILNFDKTNNRLIMKISDDKVLEIDMGRIEGFSLEDNTNKYMLLHLSKEDPNYLVQVYKDSLFSLYRSLNTKFYKSNYENKGLYESGYKYDRYVDENNYFIQQKDGSIFLFKDVNKAEMNKIILAYPSVKEFLKKNKLPQKDENKDAFLTSLTIFLNKPAL